MKRRICIIFIIICMLAGCVQQEPIGSEPTIAQNPFTLPSEVDTTEKPASAFYSHSFVSDTEISYAGGELHVPFQCAGVEIGGKVGYLLILDGRPQPYKLTENGEYSYIHTISPLKNSTTFEFIFTPMTGKAGDTLELYAVNVLDPDHRVSEDGIRGSKHTSGSIPVMNTIHYLASPEQIAGPDVKDRVLGAEIRYSDTTAKDIAGWSDEELRSRSDYRISVNDSNSLTTFWNTSADEPIRVHLEIWGNPDAEFGVLFYLNGQPVSLDEANMLVNSEQGKTLVMDIQMDNTDLEEESILYAVIVYRNLRQFNTAGLSWFTVTSTYYFMSQEEPL